MAVLPLAGVDAFLGRLMLALPLGLRWSLHVPTHRQSHRSCRGPAGPRELRVFRRVPAFPHQERIAIRRPNPRAEAVERGPEAFEHAMHVIQCAALLRKTMEDDQ
jgi:hypothetical protein